MALVMRLTVLVTMLVFMVAPVLFAAEGRLSFPAGVSLELERTVDMNGTPMEHLIQRDIARHRRGLLDEVQGTSIGLSPLSVLGSVDHYTGWPYLTRLKIGNPQKVFTLVIDTGSDTLWVSCRTCSNCPTSSGVSTRESYDPSESSTSSMFACSDKWCQDSIKSGLATCDSSESQDIHCGYDMIYGSGSTIGCSNIQSGGLAAANLAFDGVIGIGPNRQSVNSQLNSIGQAPMVFSLCLKSSDSGSGILVLGEAVEPGMVYTPLIPTMYYYSVYLESIAVNGQKLPIDPSVFNSHNRRTFFDSGTALAYLPDEPYETFLTAISASVSLSPLVRPFMNNGEHCFATSSSLDLSFPPVTLHFTGGAELLVMPRNYLLPQGLLDGESLFCLGWKRQEGKPNTILGDIVLMDKLIVYDVENMRLGWVNYDCSQAVNITTSNHWNKTSNQWNKRQGNSGHKSYNVVIPIGVAVMLTCIFGFWRQVSIAHSRLV
ncbi:unnamed protein product [Urochloa decumbens]|uniref:Peptidase A1 domain-containing protein n=1 Tax=Urochloa decumbens TaxID=240449 RepID=A0ABC8YZV2_9POAL